MPTQKSQPPCKQGEANCDKRFSRRSGIKQKLLLALGGGLCLPPFTG